MGQRSDEREQRWQVAPIYHTATCQLRFRCMDRVHIPLTPNSSRRRARRGRAGSRSLPSIFGGSRRFPCKLDWDAHTLVGRNQEIQGIRSSTKLLGSHEEEEAREGGQGGEPM